MPRFFIGAAALAGALGASACSGADATQRPPLAAEAAHQASARGDAEADRWAVYGGGPAHRRFAPVDGLHAGNVGALRIAWRWRTSELGPVPESRNASTPLLVDGMAYVTAGSRRAVAALDAATGRELWRWENEEEERLDEAPRVNSGRGVAWWSDDDGRGRVLTVTPGYRLVALDAATGMPVPGFGRGGVVDLMEEHRTRPGVPLVGTVGSSSPPTVVGDVVVVGSAHHVGMRPPSRINTPGDVRGYDVRTGALLWTFHTIPREGEEGYESWLEGSAEYTGNAGVWAPISFDPELGYVYLPTEAATGDLYGGHRPGDNLFSTSLVALEARTGRKVWHQQIVRHDIWDWDNPTAPVLADVTVDGVPRKVVAQVTKQAFVYVFDRVTGEPVWPLEERSVPASDVPGERAAPTQRVPTRPAPFGRQGFSEDDLLDWTPEIRARAFEVARRYRWGELFSPPSRVDDPDGTQGTLMMPSTTGGANWEGAALDPATSILYVPTASTPSVYALEPGGDVSDMDWIATTRPTSVAPGVPLVRPPWGTITAIDLDTGDRLWSVVNGDTPEHVARRLGLDPASVPRTGKPIRSLLVVTPTLLLAGEGFGGDPVLWALDKATGAVVARVELPAAATGHPVVWEDENGRPWVLVAVGSIDHPAEFVALTLP